MLKATDSKKWGCLYEMLIASKFDCISESNLIKYM